MIKYEDMKEALAKECNSLRYFTRSFYETFMEERSASTKNFIQSGKWLQYTLTNESDFYNKNGFAYCIMLEKIYASLEKFTIKFFEVEDERYYNQMLIEKISYHGETEKEALSVADAYMKFILKSDADLFATVEK